MKKILCIFTYSDKKGRGWGRIDFAINNGKVLYEDILEIEKHLECAFDYKSVIIINIIELEG